MVDRSELINDIHFETHLAYSDVAEVWKGILPENHHLCCMDIYAPEESQPEDIEFRYVTIFRQKQLIGVMYLQCLNFNSKHYHHGIFDRPVLKQLKQCIVKQSVHLMICGNLFRVNFQGFYFIDKLEKELIFDCLQKYRLEIKTEKNICGILVKDCSQAFGEVQFSCHKFKAFNQDLTMELDLDSKWKTFEDYQSDLSRKYRQRSKKIVNAAKDLQIVDLSYEQLLTYQDRINTLYLNIVQKQSIALGILNAGYFREMKKRLQDKFKVFGYFKGDNLLAFSSHIYYPLKEKMEIHYIGMDYEFNNTYNLYFNILFDGIKEAINGRYKTIEMGRTAREAKANAGAHPVENFNYIWIKPGLIRLVVSFLGSWFDKNIGEDWQRRNPFKSTVEISEIPEPVQT